MDREARLMQLIDISHFIWEAECDSSDRLMEIGKHNLAEYERLEAINPDVPERIWSLVCSKMAEDLQSRVMEEYGEFSTACVREFLIENTGEQSGPPFEKCIELAKQALANEGFDGYQLEQLYQLFDLLPSVVLNFIAEGAARYRLLPVAEVSQITGILCEMIREANDANIKRHN